MSTLPDDKREAVILEIYKQADARSWDSLTPADRTKQYNAWLDDPNIGGVLLPYMSREGARVWIKDGPMKERNRALSGRGPNAHLVPNRVPGPDFLVKATLGRAWTVDTKTFEDKPARCVVAADDEKRLMIWGPPKNLSDLVFAAVVARAEGRPVPFIVLTSRPGQEPGEAEQGRHRSICSAASTTVYHVTERLIPGAARRAAE